MKRLLLLLVFSFTLVKIGLSQVNKPVLDLKKFTDRSLIVRQMLSTDRNCYEFYKNGIKLIEGQDYFIGPGYPNSFYYVGGGTRGGFYSVAIEFGFFKPNDVLTVKDICRNEISDPIVVTDDYVYVEVPKGNSYSSNGIDATYSQPAYDKLSSPVVVGKCEPISINSHVLMATVIDITTESPISLGTFKVNGSNITTGGFSSYFAGNPTSYQISSGQVITSNFLKLTANAYYSGSTPYSIEYKHNGSNTSGFDFTFGVGGVQVRFITNNSFEIWKRNYLGDFDISHFDGDFSNSTYKISFDESSYRIYVDGVEYGKLDRFVKYTTTTGSLDNSSVLPYRTGVKLNPSSSGIHYVSATIDGVLNVYQKLLVVEDISLSTTVVNSGCAGVNSGSINVLTNGGQEPFSYSLNNGAFQSSNIFSSLAPGSYTIKVRDASGCESTISAIVSGNSPLSLSSSVQNETCFNQKNGRITFSATGGSGIYTYSIDGQNYISNNVFDNLSTGTYAGYVKDLSGCISTNLGLSISADSKLLPPSVIPSNVTCFGGNNGSLSINTSNSIPNGSIQYSVDGGVNFGASSQIQGLSAGNYQIIIKDNLCNATTSGTISQPSEIIPAVNIQNQISCNGQKDGALLLGASGGVSPYEYSLDNTNYSSNSTRSNLGAGNYKVWIKDANGCIKESGITTISDPSVLIATLQSKQDITCNGNSTGQIMLGALGGTLPYSYKLSTQASYSSNNTISDLKAGLYTVQVQDGHQCVTSMQVELLEASSIVVSVTQKQDILCNGASTGQLTAQASGGNGAYTYSLEGTNYQSNNIFSGLKAGAYSIYVKDITGCVKILQGSNSTLTEPSALEMTLQSTAVKCNGEATGSITANVGGGVGGYLYSIDNVNFITSNQFTSLNAGNYVISLKDANNCTLQKSVQVTEPTVLTANLDILSQVLCFGGNSGSIKGLASGGIGPYQYSLDGNAYQNNDIFSSLSIGEYKLWIKDANACITTSTSKTVTQPTDITFTINSVSAVKCYQGNDGAVTLQTTGGAGNYSYSINGSAYQTVNTFNNLTNGTYSFVVKDGNNCQKSVQTTVSQPAQAYTISLASTENLSCFENKSGKIVVNSQGGTAPYWVGLSTNNLQANPSFEQLTAGSYSVYGKDANNCSFSLGGINLTQPSDISFSTLMKKDVDCDYYSKGEAKVLATGSNGGFSYMLSGNNSLGNSINPISNTTGYFNELASGDYRVTATDVRGCSKNYTVTIIPKNSKITFDVNKSFPSTCNSNDGVITITNVQGGRNGYNYQLSTQQTASPNSQFSGLSSGTYVITVSDELCYYRKNIDLSAPNGIRANYQVSGINCTNSDGNISVINVTGGNGGYLYKLNNNPETSNSTFNNLSPNIYAIEIRDTPQSCKYVLSVELKEQNRADLQLTNKSDVLCFGGNSGIIAVSGNNNQSPFQYSINNGVWQSSGRFEGLSKGTYKLSTINALGCQDSLHIIISEPALLVESLSKTDNLCFGDATGKIFTSATGGVSPYHFSKDNQSYQSETNFENLKKGDYTIWVKDANNCISTKTITLIEPPQLIINPYYQDTIRCFGETNGVISIPTQGGTPTYSYSLDGTNYISNNSFGGLGKGNYTIHVKDANQCKTEKTLNLTEPNLLEITQKDFKNPLCYKSKDGIIEVVSTGGNNGNIYTIDYQNRSQNSTYFNNLPDGTYSVKVTDRKGCLAIVSNMVLAEPSKIKTVSVGTMPLCYGDGNGKINIAVNGGTPNYRVNFEGLISEVNGTNYTKELSNLFAKAYTFYVLDSHNCVDTINYTLTQPTQLQNKITIKENDCFGDLTGQVQVLGLQATPPYRYSLQNQEITETFESTGIFSKLKSNNYIVTVFDFNNCKLSTTIKVAQPDKLVITPIYQDTIRCFGENNGAILLKVTGGIKSYIYSKDSTNYFSDSLFTGLKAGLYNFWVKDANKCLATSQLSATEPALLDLSLLSKSNPLCLGESNGIVQLKATGGNGGNIYWQDNATKQSNDRFIGLTQGQYTYKVVDRKGCQDTVRLVELKWPSAVLAQVSKSIPICYGTNTAKLNVQASGGVGAFTAILSNTNLNKTIALNSGKGVFDSLNAGNYLVKIKDANGCQLQLTNTIQETDSLETFTLGSGKGADTLCIGQSITLDAKNKGKNIRWYFNGTEGVDELARANQSTYTIVSPGIYKVSVSNKTGCMVEKSYTLTNSKNALKADFILATQAFVGDTVVVLNTTKPAPDKVVWTPPLNSIQLSETNSKLTFIPTLAGNLSVTLRAFAGVCDNVLTRTTNIFTPDNIDQTDSLYHYRDYPVTTSALYPNPNQGRFELSVKTKFPVNINISIVRVSTGETVYNAVHTPTNQNLNSTNVYNFNLSLRIGAYSLILESGKQKISKLLMITN
ncbi:SprB repeat-containing protein [Flectobacillus longus]|uniref:SprB repeat-containing protein n=1 Tax=Flectobacillus longus TaxID=2984207 RepID=UPI0024B783A6|nr:SprB repeat-containing protein [Flectobacillus longus]MDI9881107.1 SprB repeat-containing protein [Flectobacillus longus]